MTELTHGQVIPLVTADGEPLTRVRMGVGWDKDQNAGVLTGSNAPEIDLDASAVQFGGGKLFDLAFYNNLSTRDGSVVHQGDNVSGRGEGDDEAIAVDLTKVYHAVDAIVFAVSSYQGHSLEWIRNAYCRLVDDTTDTELARFTMTAGVPRTGLVLATVFRDGTDQPWQLRAVGQGIAMTVPTESVDALAKFAVSAAGGPPAPA